MTYELIPVDVELAEQARCWMCKDWFTLEDCYVPLAIGDCLMVTCVGCACTLITSPS